MRYICPICRNSEVPEVGDYAFVDGEQTSYKVVHKHNDLFYLEIDFARFSFGEIADFSHDKTASIPSEILHKKGVIITGWRLSKDISKDFKTMKRAKFKVDQKVVIETNYRRHYSLIPGDMSFHVKDIKTNKTSNGDYVIDYFISVPEEYGGKFEKRLGKIGLWYSENCLKSEENENSNSPKKGDDMSTDMVSYSPKDVRTFNAVLPPVTELARQGVFYLLTVALKAANKSKEIIRSWLTIAKDFLENNKDEANAIFKWVIGFLCKHVHKLRALPGMKDVSWLVFLENEDVRKFGHYSQDASEGELIGELIAKAVTYLQTKIMGFAEAGMMKRFAEVMENPGKLPGILTEASEAMRIANNSEMEALAAEEMKVHRAATASLA